jgi:ABC-type multidrug transport system permease subunit
MIGELNIGGVFVPTLLTAAVAAFCLTSVVRWSLRRWRLYRFVWHAGLFDVAMFIVLLCLTTMASTVLTPHIAGVQ